MRTFISTYKLDILFAVFALFYLSVILTSLYISDDTYNFMVGRAFFAEHSLFTELKGNLILGRFLPINLVLFPVFGPLFYLMQTNIIAYKLIVVILTIMAIFILGYLVKYISGSDKLKFLAMTATLFSLPLATLYQHSPMYVFYGHMQYITIFILIGIIGYLKYIEGYGKKWLIVSILFFVFSLLYYEMSYILIGLPFILSLVKGEKFFKAIKSCLPIVIAFVLCTIVYFVMHSIFYSQQATYQGISLSFDFIGIIKTYISQTSAALPLGEWWGALIDGNSVGFVYKPIALLESIQIKDLLAIVLWTLFFYFVSGNLNKVEELKNKTLRVASVIGLYLLLTPGILIAITPKYQSELFIGRGYIPVFLECFGMGVLLALLYYKLIYSVQSLKTFLKYFTWILGIFIILIVQINARVGLDVLYVSGGSYNFNKSSQSLDSGLLVNIEKGDYIVTGSPLANYPETGVNSNVLSGKFKKRVTSVSPDDYIKYPDLYKVNRIMLFEMVTVENTNSFYVSIASPNVLTDENKRSLIIDSVRLFIPKGFNKESQEFLSLVNKLGTLSELNKTRQGTVYLLSLTKPSGFYELQGILYKILSNIWFASKGSIQPNRLYPFGYENKKLLAKGFYGAELWGRWSTESHASISFELEQLPAVADVISVVMTGQVLGNAKMALRIGDYELYKIDKSVPSPWIFDIPVKLVENNIGKLDIDITDAQSPASIQGSNSSDERLLGIGISSFEILFTSPIILEQKIMFNDGMGHLKLKGVSHIEAWGRWTVGDNATVSGMLPDNFTAGNIGVTLDGSLFNPKDINIDIFSDNVPVGRIDGKTVFPYKFILPENTIKNGKINLTMQIENAASPFDLKMGSDERKLGIGLNSITFGLPDGN